MSSKSLTDRADGSALKSTSLRHRLLRFIIIPLLTGLLIAGMVSFYSAHKETAEMYDKQLVLLAQVLLSLAAQEDDDEEAHTITRYDTILAGYGENTFSYRIWINGKIVLTTPNARNFRSGVLTPGFSDQKFDGEMWRVFIVRNDAKHIIVEVTGKESFRTDIIREILLFMFVPLMLVVPVIAALVWFGVVRGLAPISTLSSLVKDRDPENLAPFSAAEVPHGTVPEEIVPLVDALNHLMRRMGHILEMEKTFTDHAAHELRTPLAAMKVQAQVALRAKGDQERQQMLNDLVTGVDRAGHLVSQLLALARAGTQQGKMSPVNLGNVLEEVVNEFDPLLRNRRQVLDAKIASGIDVVGIEELLHVLCRNLIDNATKYAPPGSTIHLQLTRQGDNISLVVANPGPGIPESEQENIFMNFYRLPGNVEPGCGLGLALVRRISDIHHAEINLVSPDKNGLTRFTISFRTAATNAACA